MEELMEELITGFGTAAESENWRRMRTIEFT